MSLFKIWGEEDIVRDVEDFTGTVDYDHVESYVGSDELTAPDLSRPVRNVFENQNWIYQYLESVADMQEDASGVYRNSLGHAFALTSGTDFLTLAVAGSFETTQITVNQDNAAAALQNLSFTMYDGTDTPYYFWYNSDGAGSDPGGTGTGVPIAITTGDDIDDVIIATVNAMNALNSYTSFNATPNYVTNVITVITTIVGDVTDSADVDTGFTITPINGSATYRNYVRVTPGVARVNNTIFTSMPRTNIAERQLERILGLETDETNSEYVTITYDYTNDKYQARIYTKNPSTGIVGYDEFVNGGTWGTATDGYDTGVELIHAIFSNSKFTTALYNALGGYNFEYITLEPTLVITATGSGVVRYLYIDSSTYEFTWASSAGTGNDLNLYTVDFDATASSITINSATSTRTFFQREVDYQQELFLNVPRTISGEAGDPGTENTAGLDFTKVTNQDVTITVLRQNAGSDDSSYIMWDESAGNFDSNRDLLIRENLVPVPRGNNQIATTNTINENIDTLDAAIGGTITPLVRASHPIIDANTLNANLSALDAAIGITPVPVTTRTNNPIIGSNTVVENLEALDAAIGIDVTPVARTNNPLVVNTSVNTKLDTLDAAIGSTLTPVVTRSTNPVAAANSVMSNIDALDAAIGPDVIPSTRTFNPVSTSNSSNVNISALEAAVGNLIASPITRSYTQGNLSNSASVNSNLDALDAAIGSNPSDAGTITYIVNNATINQNIQALDDELATFISIATPRTAEDTLQGFIKYAGDSATTAGQFNGTTTNPSGVLRLNYEGYLYATRFYATSTREAKDNIQDFSGSALDILNSTEIKSYNYKGDSQKTVGFIAEDTNPLLSTEKQTNFDITNTIGVLIKAVQELSEEVRILKGATA